MMWFWILATTLVVVVLGVLLRPLLRPATLVADNTAASNLRLLREQVAELDAEQAAGRLAPAQHTAARAELERRVLDETRVADTPVRAHGGHASALVLAVAVPTLAVLLYGQLGNRAALDGMLAQAPAQATAEDVDALVQRLADRMKAQPEDPAGWLLLARAYGGLQRFPESRDAYAQALKRQAPDAQLLADYADVLAMTQGRTLIGEPEKLVLQALALEPDHLKALALAGTAAMERGDPQTALKHWTRAKTVAPAGSPFASGLDPAIADARAAAGLPAIASTAPAGPPAEANPAVTPAAAPLVVSVRLAPALAGRLQPGDTLFVFARAAEGPRMPLAIVRQPAGAGPVQVQLDDSSAMAPQLKLSGFAQVVVGARISRSGNATPQAGDLEGQSAPRASSGSVELVIDRVRD
ncbi:MAG: c-type cytochrome biogenesis protein CcmI [Rubrivivax sp.]|nr:c-type cytochrome biogenesis protein CcmI [Rubrivivax sp.]